MLRNHDGEPVLAWTGVVNVVLAFHAKLLAPLHVFQAAQLRNSQVISMGSECLEFVRAFR